MNPKNYVLYSGGAQGSEAEFGKLAEKFGYKLVDHRLELYGSKIKK